MKSVVFKLLYDLDSCYLSVLIFCSCPLICSAPATGVSLPPQGLCDVWVIGNSDKTHFGEEKGVEA